MHITWPTRWGVDWDEATRNGEGHYTAELYGTG
jgi:hypothetical protein